MTPKSGCKNNGKKKKGVVKKKKKKIGALRAPLFLLHHTVPGLHICSGYATDSITNKIWGGHGPPGSSTYGEPHDWFRLIRRRKLGRKTLLNKETVISAIMVLHVAVVT